MIRFTSLLLLLCLTPLQASADGQSWTSERGLFVVTYGSDLVPPQINQLHGWLLHLEDDNGDPVIGAAISVDGGMPAHDHGLPTRPKITGDLGDGNYRLDGLRYHMRGEWQLSFSIDANGKLDTVVIKVTL